jgi:hypothetical protein
MKAQGMFRVQSRRYGVPNLARAYWMDDDAVDHEVERFAPERVPIDAGTWNAPVRGGHVPRAIEPEEDDQDGTAVGVIVEDDPETVIFMAVCSGLGTPKRIAEHLNIPDSTIRFHLRALARKGMIKQDGMRKPWRKA